MDPTVNTSALRTVKYQYVTVKLENVFMGVGLDGKTLHVMKVRHAARCID